MAAPSAAQPAPDPRGEVFAGSEAESYLRLLQITGRTSFHPWSVRSFGPRDLERLSLLRPDEGHVWQRRYDLAGERAAQRISPVGAEARLTFNSGFPYGPHEGAVWSGRGATVAVRGGVHGALGPLSLTLAPVAFVAVNQGFELEATARPDSLGAYANARSPRTIDQPQRFGDGQYARIDPGESTLRLDLGIAALGVSTANQHWGPARDHPMILGRNAGGFLHGFVGSSRPVDIGLGRVHGRVVWGTLAQSRYSVMTGEGSRRFMSGMVGVLQPARLQGFEIGGARFFHLPYPTGGLEFSDFAKVFEGFLKSNLDLTGPDRDNQLLSVFARWVLPRAGFEVYGEYGREDHSWDLTDFVLQPDHNSAYMVGFQKAWENGGGRVVVLRSELVNSRRSHLAAVRGQTHFYSHSRLRQGHTHRGQVLGSPIALGGGGGDVAVDVYDRQGRWTLRGARELVGERGASSIDDPADTLTPSPVRVVLDAERLHAFRRGSVTIGLAGIRELRDGDDRFNLNVRLGFHTRR